MKSCKSYTCRINGNSNKIKYLESTLQDVDKLSSFVFNSCSKKLWENQKTLYKICRYAFPNINSKILQNFISLYKKKGKRPFPKQPVKSAIFVDQGFNIEKNKNSKLTSFWLRFCRKNFPLFGKNLNKIKDLSKIKIVQIFKKTNSKLYCKITYVEDLPDPQTNENSKTIGIDVNAKRIVLSNGKFFHINDLYHRKIEHYKNNLKHRNTSNFTKDYLHKLTTKISKYLSEQKVEVLLLENLTNLRKSASKKLGTSKGKKLNYIINSMSFGLFQNLLEYKCLDLNIKVEKINPAYTSKTCSYCGSRNTSRPTQSKFICNNCLKQLDADLNGSRNIEIFYKKAQWATSESSPS